MACANRIVRRSLKSLYLANHKPDAQGLYGAYLSFGDVPSVFGEPKVRYDPYVAVEWEIRKITAEKDWRNDDYLRRWASR